MKSEEDREPVGVFCAERCNPPGIPQSPQCLCWEHRKEQISGCPYQYPLTSEQALWCIARCTVCGKYLTHERWDAALRVPKQLVHDEQGAYLRLTGLVVGAQETEAGVMLTVQVEDQAQRCVITVTAPIEQFLPFPRVGED